MRVSAWLCLPVPVNIAFGSVNQFPTFRYALFTLGDNFGKNAPACCPYNLGCRVVIVIIAYLWEQFPIVCGHYNQIQLLCGYYVCLLNSQGWASIFLLAHRLYRFRRANDEAVGLLTRLTNWMRLLFVDPLFISRSVVSCYRLSGFKSPLYRGNAKMGCLCFVN